MSKQQFAGDKKVGKSILSGVEKKFKDYTVPRIPSWLETYHLTLLTLVWSILNVYFGFQAKNDLNWLWLVSLMIFFQYITDVLDGSVGRYRNTGLVKWGFYMDHLLDFFFMSSIAFVGYVISPVGLEVWYLFLMVIIGGFMVNSFLSFAATNEFEIFHFGLGPSEGRIAIILANTYIILAGTKYFEILVPTIVFGSLVGLIIQTYQAHKKLWKIDMDAKRER